MRSVRSRHGWSVAAIAVGALFADASATRAQVPNRPPVAVHDVAEVTAGPGAGVTIDVRANDIDPDGDALLVVAVGTPTHGSTLITSRGQPNYTPDPGFTGLDSFTYTVADGRGGSATGVVFVAVSSLDPICSFARGTTTCRTKELDLESSERVVTTGCLAGPGGVPGVRRDVFVDTDLTTTTNEARSRGRRGPVYDISATTTTERIFSQLVTSTCEPIG